MLDFVNLEFIPNYFSNIIEESDTDPPSRFDDDGLSKNFLLNVGNIIEAFLIM